MHVMLGNSAFFLHFHLTEEAQEKKKHNILLVFGFCLKIETAKKILYGKN